MALANEFLNIVENQFTLAEKTLDALRDHKNNKSCHEIPDFIAESHAILQENGGTLLRLATQDIVANNDILGYFTSFLTSPDAAQLIMAVWQMDGMTTFADAAFKTLFASDKIPKAPRNDTMVALRSRLGFYDDSNKLTDEDATELVNLSFKDEHCWDYATLWLKSYIIAGEKLPSPLRLFAFSIIDGQKRPAKSGAHKEQHFFRDLAIKMVAEAMLRKFGGPLERNAVSEGMSIGKAIAEAIRKNGENISESAVRKVALRPWEKFGSSGTFIGKWLPELFPMHFKEWP